MKVYLDTSALVKRYIEEDGSDKVDYFFEKTYREEAIIVISQWNIGEAAVVFDKYKQRKIIKDAYKSLKLLYRELYVLSKLGFFRVLPVSSEIITKSIPIILKHHIYLADAIQIATCKKEKCEIFLTFDKKLENIAKAELT